MASKPAVALRLGMEGAEQIQQGLTKIGESGDAAAKRLAAGFERTGESIESLQAKMAATIDPVAIKRYATEIEDLQGKLTAAGQKISAIGGGFTFGGPDQGAQVKAYNAYLAEQERQTKALLDAIDPLRVAQRAYDAELRTANSLLAQGAISEEQHAASVRLSGEALDLQRKRLQGVDEAHGHMSTSGAIMQHVVRSTADSFAAACRP